MSEKITTYGLVATTPRHIVTSEGLPITSFRIASTQDDDTTNWYTVTAYKQLAINLASSFHKGERVIISGDLKVKDWDNGERSGTHVEIEVESAGHDLSWGTSAFNRTVLVRERTYTKVGKNEELERVKRELSELKEKLAELAEEN